MSARAVTLASGEPFQIDPVLRELAGRRLSGGSTLDGRRVFAKAFLGADATRYAERELQGLKALGDAGQTTAPLLRRAELENGTLLLLGWLDGEAPAPDDGDGAVALAELLAVLHERGVLLRDPHLGNFLLTDTGVACVDGDGVRRQRRLTREAALDNLGRLLAEFHLSVGPALTRAMRQYSDSRGWLAPLASEAVLTPGRQARRELIEAKVMRECSLVSRGEMAPWTTWYWRAEASLAESVLSDPMRALTHAETLKAGNSAEVYRIAVGGRSLVLKRYRNKTLARLLRRALSGSRAARAWRTGCALGFFGVATPQPLGLAIKARGPFVADAWLLCEDAGVTTVLDEAQRKPELAAQGADLLRQLRALGLCHGDAKATNLLVHEGVVSLIDLDGVCAFTERRWRRDIERYLANWPEGSEPHQAARVALFGDTAADTAGDHA